MFTTFRHKLITYKLVVTAVVSLCSVISNTSASQSLQRPEPIIVDGSNNETTKAELDLLAQKAGSDKLIILIARPGRKELSRRVSKERLRTVRDYLRFTRTISKDRLVTAEGETDSDAGQVEAYVDGKLFMVFRLPLNKNFAREP